jgi:hypothetical protein
MQAIKHILSVILVAAILMSGLPMFSPEDANRDSRVDLEDVILQVRELASTAEEPGSFTASMEKTISTLRLLAGFKTAIKADTTKSSVNSFNLNLPYLISAYIPSNQSGNYHAIQEKLISYVSFIITPSSPPPQFV